MATVLVIDMDPSTRTLLRTVLRAKGHDVLLTDSGANGVVLFSRRAPDVTILNPALSAGAGMDVLQQLRGLRTDAETILFGSALADRERRMAADLQVHEIVQKEFSLHHLGAALQAALVRQKGKRHGPPTVCTR